MGRNGQFTDFKDANGTTICLPTSDGSSHKRGKFPHGDRQARHSEPQRMSVQERVQCFRGLMAGSDKIKYTRTLSEDATC
jgi:hypothetical protein